MGLSLGGQAGGSSNTTTGSGTATANSSGTSAATPTYTGEQSSLQSMLSQVFSSLLPAASSGGISPNVQAVQTAGADQINKTAAASGDKMNRFLASRGFGQSGQVGQSELQTELGRQAALGANASAASGLQLAQNNTALQDALTFAFQNPGKTGTTSDTGTTSQQTTQQSDSFGWKFGGGVGGSFPGAGGAGANTFAPEG